MADQVTWSPRVGASGADRYDMPADELTEAGPSGGYSAVPTLPEINVGSNDHINQVIAEMRRRQDLSSLTLTAYRIANVDVVSIADLHTAIDLIRTTEGQAAFGFTTPDRVTVQSVSEIREALASQLELIRVTSAGGVSGRIIQGSLAGEYPPAGILTAVSTATVTPLAGIDGDDSGGAGSIFVRRGYQSFALPAGAVFLKNHTANFAYRLLDAHNDFADWVCRFYSVDDWGTLDTGDFDPTGLVIIESKIVNAALVSGAPSFANFDFANDLVSGSTFNVFTIHQDDDTDVDPGIDSTFRIDDFEMGVMNSSSDQSRITIVKNDT